MVHKNYKWNISKKEGEKIVLFSIKEILQEQKEHNIQIDELIFLLNNRTKHIKLYNNKKKKNIKNFIKTNFGGIVSFLELHNEFMITKKNNEINVQLNVNKNEIIHNILHDWIFVEDI